MEREVISVGNALSNGKAHDVGLGENVTLGKKDFHEVGSRLSHLSNNALGHRLLSSR